MGYISYICEEISYLLEPYSLVVRQMSIQLSLVTLVFGDLHYPGQGTRYLSQAYSATYC